MDTELLVLTGVVVAVIAVVFILTSYLHRLPEKTRSRWLSLAGGASVAYVFTLLIPELTQRQAEAQGLSPGLARLFDDFVFLAALLGLVAFYGLEWAVQRRRKGKTEDGQELQYHLFEVHLIAFAVYAVILGYLLLNQEAPGLRDALFFGIAIALHLFTVAFDMHREYTKPYNRLGRWVMVAAIATGWGIGMFMAVHGTLLAALYGFVGGGIILNVLKEELPGEQQSNFWAFLTGAAFYAAVIVVEGMLA